jgi:glyoxylase-like metal-dependent hydrolase (beta-lactamase superfamily II)
MVPKIPNAYVRLMDGARVRIGERVWQCISGFGHSPEHMALHNAQDQLLISGDMLLPSISTNVSVYAMEPDSNPLQLFLDSLEKMAHLPDSTLVLPSHGRPFQSAAKIAWPSCCRPAVRRRAAPTSCCLCFSNGPSMCTKPPSPWAKPWPT